jgi:hypothetical protein
MKHEMKNTELNSVFNLVQVRESSFNCSVEDFSVPGHVAVGENSKTKYAFMMMMMIMMMMINGWMDR